MNHADMLRHVAKLISKEKVWVKDRIPAILAAADYIDNLHQQIMSDLAERLRDGTAWRGGQPAEDLAAEAADYIEQLEAEIATLRPHRSQTVAYAEGHGPEDPPRPVLERTELAQREFNDRTRHGE